jgi:hypothetical protein
MASDRPGYAAVGRVGPLQSMPSTTTKKAVANPCCTTDGDLPEPPAIGELCDPAEPHPDEPGAPPDTPGRVSLGSENAEEALGTAD